MSEVTLKLNVQEVNAILAGLSALPTGQNVWPLAMRIKKEAEEQLPPPAEKEPEAE